MELEKETLSNFQHLESDAKLDLPKFLIITPSYNQGDYIEETILSVINQNYPNLEYVIIDGGSNDKTVEVIKKYEKHIHFWVSEKDYGQAQAINKGLKKGSGDIIGYLNSDDCLLPNALQAVATSYLNTISPVKSKLVFCGSALAGTDLNNANNITINVEGINWSPIPIAHGYGICPQPSTFWTNSDLLFDESLQFCLDLDFWFRLAANGYEAIEINQPLAFCRGHEQAKTSTIEDIMWLELAMLPFKHSSYAKNFKDRIHIISAYKYKLRGYIRLLLKKQRIGSTRKEYLKNVIYLYHLLPDIFFNAGFIKFIIKTFISKNA